MGIPEEISAVVEVLEASGVTLGFPYSSKVNASDYDHMRELRVQHKGDPYRILYAFDPRRMAILLIGGNKTGDDRWHKKYVPVADKLYRKHLEELDQEKGA